MLLKNERIGEIVILFVDGNNTNLEGEAIAEREEINLRAFFIEIPNFPYKQQHQQA